MTHLKNLKIYVMSLVMALILVFGLTVETQAQDQIDPVIGAMVDAAMKNLSQQLGSVQNRDITPWHVTAITYPDSSLGCPAPGQSYTKGSFTAYDIRITAPNPSNTNFLLDYHYRATLDASRLFQCTQSGPGPNIPVVIPPTPVTSPTPVEITPTETASPQPTIAASPVPAASVLNLKAGSQARFASWHNNRLYVSNAGDGTLSVFDLTGKQVDTIQVGGAPNGMDWAGDLLWVADFGTDAKPGDSVNVVDPSVTGGKIVNTFKVGAQPINVAYDSIKQQMWIALYGAKSLVALGAKGQVVRLIGTDYAPRTIGVVNGVIWAALGGTLAYPGNFVMEINGFVHHEWQVDRGPNDLTWDDVNKLLYVADMDDNTIMALDTNGIVQAKFYAGQKPVGIAMHGKYLWVALAGENAIVAFDTNHKPVYRLQLDSSLGTLVSLSCGEPTHIWAVMSGNAQSTVAQIDLSQVPGALS